MIRPRRFVETETGDFFRFFYDDAVLETNAIWSSDGGSSSSDSDFLRPAVCTALVAAAAEPTESYLNAHLGDTIIC